MTAPARLRLRVPAELRFLLHSRHRAAEISVPYDGTSSLGHVIQSLGIPLTEVGALTVDDTRVAPAFRPPGGSLVTLSGTERPQPLPGTPRFLLDVHLGTLARRLRLLGVDSAYRNDLDDEELLHRANDERRVLLTRDRGLLRRRALWQGAFVRGRRPDEQLRDVLTRFAPPLAPWTRCPACNGTLRSVPKADIAHLLRPGTRRTYDTFTRCADCHRVYWPGAHHAALAATVDAARSLPPPTAT